MITIRRGATKLGPFAFRCLSSNAPSSDPPPPDPETMKKIVDKLKHENKPKALPKHVTEFPDLPADDAANIAEVACLSGQPKEHSQRTVIISQNPKSDMTTFKKDTYKWHIRWDCRTSKVDPLMGWPSSEDPMESLDLKFDDKERAIRFCQKNGWKYQVMEPAEFSYDHLMGEKSYSYNFLSEGVLLEVEQNKTRTKHFAMPGKNNSHYFRPLNYHGTRTVDQHGPSQK